MIETTQGAGGPRLPRITIQFCTQCKWMLRAAYYAQELLSTFSTSLGEVALQPATGGVFVVEMITTTSSSTTATPPSSSGEQISSSSSSSSSSNRVVLWDRKTDGGFPETKELKRRVRDVIQPGRDLGHVDRDYSHHGGGGGGGDKKKKQEEVDVKREGGEGQGGKGVVVGVVEGSRKEACDVKAKDGGKCEDCD